MLDEGVPGRSGEPVRAAGPLVLFVDLFCPDGHLELNRVYLSGLVAAGAEVDCAFKAGYAEKLNVSGLRRVFEFPEQRYDEKCGPIRARWNQWVLLMAIQAVINVQRYGAIIFSSFDEIAVAMSGRWPGCVFLNHANIAGMDHSIKRCAMRALGEDSIHVVFHEFIAREARARGLRRVEAMPQGLAPPYGPTDESKALLRSIDPRLGGGKSQRVIFAPSGAKYADGFIRHLCLDEDFVRFMEARGALLVVKGMTLPDSLSSMVGIDRRLSADEYRALFNASSGLILHYPPTFTLRVSATLMECFANQKPCLLSGIEGFKAYAKHFEYQPYYQTKSDLMQGIEFLLQRSAAVWRPYRDLRELAPDLCGALPHWIRAGGIAL